MSKLILVLAMMAVMMQPAVATAEDDALADMDADSLRVLVRQLHTVIVELRREIDDLTAQLAEVESSDDVSPGDASQPEPHRPHARAFRFEYDREISIGDSLVSSVEFARQRCNIDMRNRKRHSFGVDVEVTVYNRDGVRLWRGSEYWMLASMEPEERHVASLEFEPREPEVIGLSRYVAEFDDEPYWFLVRRDEEFRGSDR